MEDHFDYQKGYNRDNGTNMNKSYICKEGNMEKEQAIAIYSKKRKSIA